MLPIHHRSPWNNLLFKKYAAKQMAVLEQLDLRNDMGQGGMTVLAVDKDRKKSGSQLKREHNISKASGGQIEADTESVHVNTAFMNN